MSNSIHGVHNFCHASTVLSLLNGGVAFYLPFFELSRSEYIVHAGGRSAFCFDVQSPL